MGGGLQCTSVSTLITSCTVCIFYPSSVGWSKSNSLLANDRSISSCAIHWSIVFWLLTGWWRSRVQSLRDPKYFFYFNDRLHVYNGICWFEHIWLSNIPRSNTSVFAPWEDSILGLLSNSSPKLYFTRFVFIVIIVKNIPGAQEFDHEILFSLF